MYDRYAKQLSSIRRSTGPYETEDACKARVLDISRQVHKYYPLWKPSRYRCQELPPVRLKWKIWY